MENLQVSGKYKKPFAGRGSRPDSVVFFFYGLRPGGRGPLVLFTDGFSTTYAVIAQCPVRLFLSADGIK